MKPYPWWSEEQKAFQQEVHEFAKTNAAREAVTRWTREFPEDLSPYRLILHCGGCMLNEREMSYRQKCAQDQGVPMTNYGIAIAYMNGILRRSTAMFPDIAAELSD